MTGNRAVFMKAWRASLPVMAGYLVLGAGFGMVLRNAGYGPGWALAMSVFIYAGAMQFVMVNLLTGLLYGADTEPAWIKRPGQ